MSLVVACRARARGTDGRPIRARYVQFYDSDGRVPDQPQQRACPRSVAGASVSHTRRVTHTTTNPSKTTAMEQFMKECFGAESGMLVRTGVRAPSRWLFDWHLLLWQPVRRWI